MNYRWAGATHVGRQRTNNEDTLHPDGGGQSDGQLVAAVADGMGGHVAGEVASRTAMASAIEMDGEAEDRVTAANKAVIEAMVADPALAGMGTTLTLAIFDDTGRVDIAHVGDSRAYLLRDGEFSRLTTDHTIVAELVAAGRLDEADVRRHPHRNLLTRVLGMAQDIDIDVLGTELASGDRVLLCSDGLTAMLADEDIRDVLREQDEPGDAAWALIEAANLAGGEDNVTVVIVDAA